MPERECSGCKSRKCGGARPDAGALPGPESRKVQTNWVNPAQHPVMVMGETSYACPRQHIHQNAAYWAWMLKFYGFYKKGFLPSSGGLLDQSNKAVEIFRVLDDANDQADREEEARARAKRNRPQGGGPARR